MIVKEQNFTSGTILPKLISFAVPLLFANLLQSFYSIADMIIVGKIVGETGLAAISNASMISFIINSFCIGITMGATVLIAQYQGAEDKQGQKETIGTLFVVSFVVSIIITIVSLFIYQPVFKLLHVPKEAMQDACDYMKIICTGTIFVFGYNAVCSIMKGMGDSKSPLYFVLIAAVVNIVLDLLLIGKMGTKGAAYATIFSQAVSFIISIIYLKHKNFIFDFRLNSFKIKTAILKPLFLVGLPAAIQMIVVNISYLLITGMLNHFGLSVAAASGIGLKINTFAGMPCWAVGQAVTTFVGHNMGAKQYNCVKDITKKGLYINIGITFFIILFVQIFAKLLIELFQKESAEVIADGILYLRICCSVNSLIYAVMYTFDSFAIGTGNAHIAMINALLDAAVIRLFVSWLLAFALNYGFTGIYIGQSLSPVIPAIIGFIYFKSSFWKKKKLIIK